MKTLSKALMVVLFAACFSIMTTSAQAQGVPTYVQQHTSNIATACVGHWETQDCLRAVSESNIVMVSNYAESLKQSGNGQSMEPLKQQCAASTAASKDEFPAYAMQSAFTECANAIYDISSGTGISPNQSHYQLLVGSVLCLSNDPRCAALESQMAAYRR